MKKLELLGLGPDGETLTLNDAEGNRYILPITDLLRATLRRDRPVVENPSESKRQMTPREIQSYIREGLSVDDVCELSALPASRVNPLAFPIVAEREYTAQLARSFSIGHDSAGLTLEELVASRLVGRGVNPNDITWDSLRKNGEPWTLVVVFVTGDREHRATWHVDLERRLLEALDDEAAWLSETQLPASTGTWRAVNTPPAPVDLVQSEKAHRRHSHRAGGEDREKADGRGSAPAEAPANARKANDDPGAADGRGKADGKGRIEEVLASLDTQRGRVRPMPKVEEDPDYDGAHPPVSAPETAHDATILSLPRRSAVDREQNSAANEQPKPDERAGGGARPDRWGKEASQKAKGKRSRGKDGKGGKGPSAEADGAARGGRSPEGEGNKEGSEAEQASPDAFAPSERRSDRSKKRRGSRPSMPSWDEIVFGKKD